MAGHRKDRHSSAPAVQQELVILCAAMKDSASFLWDTCPWVVPCHW